MKKIISILITIALVCSFFTIPASAQTSGNLNDTTSFSFNQETGCLTISGSGSTSSYDDFETFPWISYINDIKEIVVEDGITHIGNSLFANCVNVEKVTLPDSVISLGQNSFCRCSSLTDIIGGDSVEYIGESSFYDVPWYHDLSDEFSQLGSVLIKYIDYNYTENIIIPDGITCIYDYAFAENMTITSIEMPESVIYINACAFSNCMNLQRIVFPESLNEAYDDAFCALAKFRAEWDDGSCEIITKEIPLPHLNDVVGSFADYLFNDYEFLTPIFPNPNNLVLMQATFLGYVDHENAYSDDETAGIIYCSNPYCDGSCNGVYVAEDSSEPGVYRIYNNNSTGGGGGDIGGDIVYDMFTVMCEQVPGATLSVSQDMVYPGTDIEIYVNIEEGFNVNGIMVFDENYNQIDYIPYDGMSSIFYNVNQNIILVPQSVDNPDIIYYNISVEDVEGGTVAVDNTYVEEGTTVTIEVTPDSGYKATGIMIDGETYPLDGNYYYYTVYQDSTIQGIFELIQIDPPVISTTDYLGGKTVSISCDYTESPVYYSINGGEYQQYSKEFNITETTIVSAYVLNENYKSEETITVEKAADVQFDFAKNVGGFGGTLTLKSDTENVSIYYKNKDDAEYTLYSDTITIGTEAHIEAYAIGNGIAKSEITKFDHITETTEKPTLSVADIVGGKQITLSHTSENAKIYYAIDKTEEDVFIEYTAPFDITKATSTITYYASETEKFDSDKQVYTLNIEKAATPSSSHASQTLAVGTKITLTSKNNDVSNTIYYTLDGTDPTTESSVYSEAIVLENDTTIKAVAYGNGLLASDIAAFEYKVMFPTEKPVITVTDIIGGKEVSLTHSSENAKIYYAIDYAEGGQFVEYTESFSITSVSVENQVHITYYATEENKLNSEKESQTIYLYQASAPLANYKSQDLLKGTKISLTSINNEVNNTIYYTLDGTTPTKDSTLYTEEIVVNDDVTIKAIAYGIGLTVSEVSTYEYKIATVKTPEISSKAVSGGQQITITTATADAQIYYTINGSDENTYTAPFIISNDSEIVAYAKHSQMNTSSTISATIKIDKVDAPEASVKSGLVELGTKVALSTWENAKIYYTTDGTDPSEASTLYTEEIELTNPSTTIKAIAVLEGFKNSDILSLEYTIAVVAPIRLDQKLNDDYKDISLSTETQNAVIYYTLDGTEPNENSNVYSVPLQITEETRIRAVAMRAGYINSDYLDKTITLNKMLTPTANVPSGAVTYGTKLTLYSADEGALIYYTTDGTDPSTASSLFDYDNPIEINTAMTVKAISIDSNNDKLNSDILILNYTMKIAKAPTSSTENILGGKNLILQSATENAIIYYSVDDGATFTEYTEPISFYKSTNIKAYTTANGYGDSEKVDITVEIPVAEIDFHSTISDTYYDVDEDYIYSTTLLGEGYLGEIFKVQSTEGTTVYYTLDESETPSANSSVYNNNLTYPEEGTRIKLIAIGDGVGASMVYSIWVKALKVSSPTINQEVTEEGNVKVTLYQESYSHSGDKIYYTIDGTEPSENGILYSEPFEVAESCTVKAYAIKDRWLDSEVTELEVTSNRMRQPILKDQEGNVIYPENIFRVLIGDTVTLESPDGGTIYYILDDGEPIEYTGPITITDDVSIVAYVDDPAGEKARSLKLSDRILIERAAASFNVDDAYDSAVVYFYPQSGAKCYYTTDGTEPTESSPFFDSENKLTVIPTSDITVRMLAKGERMKDVTQTYTITKYESLEAPTAAPTSGNAIIGTAVTLTSPDPLARIIYTLDGTTPTVNTDGTINGNTYSEPIYITEDTKINAICIRTGYFTSAAATFTYDIPQTEPVKLVQVEGAESKTITLSSATENAKIYYTLNGTDPKTNGTLYTGEFKVTQTSTLMAYATAEGLADSEVLTQLIVINISDENEIKVSDITAATGSTVSVPVTISKNPGIASYQLSIEYDKTLVKPVKVNKSENWDGVMVSNCSSGDLDGTLNVIWIGSEDVFTSGEMFTIDFEAIQNGTSDLTLINGGVIDRYYQDAEVVFTDGSVTFTDAESAVSLMSMASAAPSDNGVTITETVTDDGENAVIQVMVDENAGIAAYDMSILFNSDAVEPVSINNGAVFESEALSNIYQPDTDLSSLSQVKVISCNDGNTDNTGVLFEVVFKITDKELYNSSNISLNTDVSLVVDMEGNEIQLTQTAPETQYDIELSATGSLTLDNSNLSGQVNVVAKNNLSSEKAGSLIFAAFDKNSGALVYTKEYKQTFASGTNNIPLDVNAQNLNSDELTYHLFVWDSITTMLPLGLSTEIQ